MYEVARERWLVSTRRASMSVDAEGATPSPRPTAARHRNRPAGQSVPAQTVRASTSEQRLLALEYACHRKL